MTALNHSFLEEMHPVIGIAPVADFNDTTQYTDIVKCIGWGKVLFIVNKGVGTSGTATITVEASSDAAASAVSAIPFRYRSYTAADDVPANDITLATTAGFATTAGSAQIYMIEVNTADLVASGYSWVRLKFAEVVNSPVLGGVTIIMCNPRYIGAKAPLTVIA